MIVWVFFVIRYGCVLILCCFDCFPIGFFADFVLIFGISEWVFADFVLIFIDSTWFCVDFFFADLKWMFAEGVWFLFACSGWIFADCLWIFC